MRLEFQKNIASGQFTLPLVSIIAFLVWVLLPVTDAGVIDYEQHGIWQLLPALLMEGRIAMCLAIGLSALTVYLIAELTNSNVLLRISSRMLSSIFAFFTGIILCLHLVLPGHVVVVFSVLSYFTLFATYQSPSPMLTFVTYLLLSTASLFFPKLLLFMPLYWGIQIYLRSFSFRCLVSSLLGVLVPYWILFAVCIFVENDVNRFVELFLNAIDIKLPQYTSLTLQDWLIFAYVVTFFLFGLVDFVINSFLDKTRTRILYNVITSHCMFLIVFILLQPQFFHTLLPMLLVDSALLGGHFISLTYNKFSHVYCLVMFALAIALVMVQVIL